MTANIAIVLPTDTVETITAVVDCVRKVAGELVEIVVVLPEAEATSAVQFEESSGARVILVPSIYPLSQSRAAGVRAASTPYVFIGETHTFPRAGMFEVLLDKHAAGWAVAVPAFENENPDSTVSWAGFLNGYAAWTPGRAAGELNYAPLFNVSYRRSFLLGIGKDLDYALTTGEDMINRLRAAKCGVWFEPAARIGHVNMSFLGPWLKQRLVAGRVIASIRSESWLLTRRIAFAVGSPFIPLVLYARIRAGTTRVRRQHDLSVRVPICIVLGMVMQSVGELIGYAFGPSATAARRYDEFEVGQVSNSMWKPTRS
jgi:hypothetical protein